jgi:hypothetical protein
MIDLDDPRWQTLSHAYGSAADIPKLLRHLASSTGPSAGYEKEPWFTLWSSLCHQGDAYDASYAALPHIVDIACNAKGPLDFSFFQLPAAIEVARGSGRGPAVPTDLEVAYSAALRRLTQCIANRLQEDWDEPTLLSAITALAVTKGHLRIAEALANLDNDLITKLIDLDFDDG